MSTKQKVILTCAVTGNAEVNPKYPYQYPITPKQICETVVEAASAGASIAHIHVRDPETGHGSRDVELFKETVARIRDTGTNIVLNLTAGMGAVFLPDPEDESKALPESDMLNAEDRLEHVKDCLPEIASLDITTGNQEEGPFEFVYLNTTRTLRQMAKLFQKYGVKPELEAFQAGDVLFGNQLLEEGLIDGIPMYQFVLGVKWASPATSETMMYLRSLLPQNKNIQWCSFGIGRDQMPMVAQAALLGGNVRVGLEDNLYMERGVFATNGQLVERGCTIIDSIGKSVATPDETREILGLKKMV